MSKNIKVYNSSEVLVWQGNEKEFDALRAAHLINSSDRIVIE